MKIRQWLLAAGTLATVGCALPPNLAADLGPPRGGTAVRALAPQPPPPPGRGAGGTGPIQRTAATEGPIAGGVLTARVVARVNGQPILFEELVNAASWRLDEIRGQVPQEHWAELEAHVYKAELEELINRELLMQDALTRVPASALEKVKEAGSKEFDKSLRKQREQLKLKSDDELRRYYETKGQSLAEMRRQFERGFVAQEYMRNLIMDKIDNIDREDMLEYYRKHPDLFNKPETFNWQHIFVDVDRFASREAARQHAQNVHRQVQQIKRAEEFAALAEQHSHGTSKYRKGEGDGNRRGIIRPTELEPYLVKLQNGQVGPLIETERGYHIFRLVEHNPGGKVPFATACIEIKQRIKNERGSEEVKRITKELRAKALIENQLHLYVK